MKNQQAETSRGGRSNTYALMTLYRSRLESNTYEVFTSRAGQTLADGAGRALLGMPKGNTAVLKAGKEREEIE